MDGGYFTWLYSTIGALRDPNPTHSRWLLAEQLHRKDFLWYIPNDDNRAADGVALRAEYYEFPIDGPCSMLEMLIALARRMEFESGEVSTSTSVGNWFWHMLENAGLTKFTDEVYNSSETTHEDVDVILERIIQRQYQRDGRGGLFPLRQAYNDQRDTELWYQLSAYLLEHYELWN